MKHFKTLCCGINGLKKIYLSNGINGLHLEDIQAEGKIGLRI